MRTRIAGIHIDCHDPNRLAEFWAEVLGFEVYASKSWDAVVSLGEKELKAREEWAGIRSKDASVPRITFAKVPEDKVVKNRVHLDLLTADREAAKGRILAFGGEIVEERSRYVEGQPKDNYGWTVMQDPEGNEFCI